MKRLTNEQREAIVRTAFSKRDELINKASEADEAKTGDLLVLRVRQYRALMREMQEIAVDASHPLGTRLEMIQSRAYFAEKGEFDAAILAKGGDQGEGK